MYMAGTLSLYYAVNTTDSPIMSGEEYHEREETGKGWQWLKGERGLVYKWRKLH